MIPTLSQTRPVLIFLPYIHKTHFNITLPSISNSLECSLPFGFSDQDLVCISHLSHRCYMPYPSHIPWLDHLNNIRWSVHFLKLLIMQPSSASCLIGIVYNFLLTVILLVIWSVTAEWNASWPPLFNYGCASVVSVQKALSSANTDRQFHDKYFDTSGSTANVSTRLN
jgi:hypothetical protein